MIRTAIAVALAAAAFSAHAAQVEIGAGQAQYQTLGNGIWYQEGFQHTLGLKSPAFMAGLTGDATRHVAWHLDYVYLGRASVDSWDTPNDANYSGHGYNGTPLPLAHYIGSGSVYGFAATLEAHTSGRLRFGVEGGPFIYRASWSLSVPNWYPSVETQPRIFEQSGPVQPVSFSQSHWALGYVVGVSARYHAWGFSLRRYVDNAGFSGHGADPWPPLWRAQTVAAVTYTF